MGKARFLWLSVIIFIGCKQQDTESLRRIGSRIADRTQEATSSLREKIGHGLPDMGNVQDRVNRRLRWDKALEGAHIDVNGTGVEVELTGTVKTVEQRRRVVDLVENTVGVEKVLDNMKVEGEIAN